MKFKHPSAWHVESHQLFLNSGGELGWDGYIRPLKRDSANVATIGRGYLPEVLDHCRNFDLKVNRAKMLPRPHDKFTVEDVRPDCIQADFKLDDGQRECIAAWMRNAVGVCDVTICGGKTAIFAGAAATIKEHHPDARIMYITVAERLVNQAYDELRKFLPDMDITRYGGGNKGKKNPGNDNTGKDVVVCSAAMLNRHKLKLTKEKWFTSFVAVLYDEVHHASSQSSQDVLGRVSAYFRFGASDSMKEDDPIKQSTIRGLFGPVVNKISADPLIEIGRIAQPHIYLVDVPSWKDRYDDLPLRAEPGTKAWIMPEGGMQMVKATYAGPVYETDDKGEVIMQTKRVLEEGKTSYIEEQVPIPKVGVNSMILDGATEPTEVDSTWCLLDRRHDRGIITFKERNKLIVEWAKYFSDRGMPTVVTATRTLHLWFLESLLCDAIDENLVDVLSGEYTVKRRDRAFEWFKKTPGSVLVTNLVKEGVSINQIRALIVADYVGSREVANQIVGRAIRPKFEGDNVGHVVWFNDHQHPKYGAGVRRVFRNFRKRKGYTVHTPVVHPTDVLPA